MEDISFSIYHNNKIQTITLQDLALNKRVLICSAVRITQHWCDHYIKHVISQIPYYKQHGIDEVYIVNSDSGLYGLARFDTHFPQLPVLSDTNGDFVTWVSELVNKTTPDLDTLSKYWSYQILLNNGQLEQFYEQPTENYIINLIKAGFKPSKKMQEFFIKEGEQVALFRANPSAKEQKFVTPDPRSEYPYHECNSFELMYFNLYPNKKLNQYLLDTNKQTSV
jgi:peroxiredoxin